MGERRAERRVMAKQRSCRRTPFRGKMRLKVWLADSGTARMLTGYKKNQRITFLTPGFPRYMFSFCESDTRQADPQAEISKWALIKRGGGLLTLVPA